MRAGLWGRLGVVTDPNVGGGSYLTMGDQYMVIFLSLFTVLIAVTWYVPGKGDFVGFQFGPVARNW